VRDYAAALNEKDKQALSAEGAVSSSSIREKGMAEMSKKFRDLGSEVYVDATAVKESNKAL